MSITLVILVIAQAIYCWRTILRAAYIPKTSIINIHTSISKAGRECFARRVTLGSRTYNGGI